MGNTELVVTTERDGPLRGRRVLLADGPESSRARHADALRKAGATVHAVGSGRAARVAWSEPPGGQAFDLAVLGYAFPDADGPTVAAALRANGTGGRIVGVTADGRPDDRSRWRSARCDLVLSGAAVGGSLVAAVERLAAPTGNGSQG